MARQRHGLQAARLKGPAASLGSDLVAFAHAAYAVSYTHLRAHETVLDLVCRLLLEKKKTIAQT